MAEKEATVYIVDVSKSMGRQRHGRTISDLEWVMQYVWDKITTTVCWSSSLIGLQGANYLLKVSTGRKTATIGVVGLGTDG